MSVKRCRLYLVYIYIILRSHSSARLLLVIKDPLEDDWCALLSVGIQKLASPKPHRSVSFDQKGFLLLPHSPPPPQDI